MGLLAAFIAELGIITYRSFTRPKESPLSFPLPADYAGAALIYGLLGLMGKTQAEPVATALGWGFVVATLLNLWTPQHPGSLAKTAPAKTTTMAKKVKA